MAPGGRHHCEYFNTDPNAQDHYRNPSLYPLAERFADQWDQTSFDPGYPTQPFEHNEPMVRQVFGRPHGI